MLSTEKKFEKINKKMGFDYLAYAQNSSNDGAKGNLFEMLIKLTINNRLNGISASHKFDLTKTIDGKKIKFECKTGSGEIAHINASGEIISSPTLKSDYIIHCLKFNPAEPLENQEIFVIDALSMVKICKAEKLTRVKMSTAMKNSEIPDSLKYKDVFSFCFDGASRSAKYYDLMYKLLDNGTAITLNEFIEMIT